MVYSLSSGDQHYLNYCNKTGWHSVTHKLWWVTKASLTRVSCGNKLFIHWIKEKNVIRTRSFFPDPLLLIINEKPNSPVTECQSVLVDCQLLINKTFPSDWIVVKFQFRIRLNYSSWFFAHYEEYLGNITF